MHFYCMRYPEQHEPMHHYMHMIWSMEQLAPPGVWLGYDREFRALTQSDPALTWQLLHPQLHLSHIAHILSFLVPQQYPGKRVFPTVSACPLQADIPVTGGASHVHSWTPEACQVFKKGYGTHFNLHRTITKMCPFNPQMFHV